MERIITVRGVGTARTKPDLVELSLELNAKDMDYNKAVRLADEKISELTDALVGIGFGEDALKTLNFNVSTSYEGVQDEKGVYRNVFDGYNVWHSLQLTFDFTAERLAETLSASPSRTPPA